MRDIFNLFHYSFSFSTSLSEEELIESIKKFRYEQHMVRGEFYFVNHRKPNDSIFSWDIVFPHTRGFQTSIRFDLDRLENEGIVCAKIELSPLMKFALLASFFVLLTGIIIYVVKAPVFFKNNLGILIAISLVFAFSGSVLEMRSQMSEIEKGLRLELQKIELTPEPSNL